MSLLLLVRNWLLGEAASAPGMRKCTVEKQQRTTVQSQNRIAHDESPARKAKPI